MAFKYPWISAGLDEVPLEIARTLAYVASGGTDGVVSPTDLRVTQTSTPGTQVAISTGAFSTVSRFPNQANQSYIGYNDSQVLVDIPANTSGGTQYWLVYAHVTDPGAVGGSSDGLAHEVDVQVIACTSSTVKLADAPGTSGITGYGLARIAVPASTSTITNSMITDLRELIHQRRSQDEYLLTGGFTATDVTSTSYTVWPPIASWNIPVPTWATRVKIIGNIGGYKMKDGGSSGGNVFGQFRATFGSSNGPNTAYNHSMPAGLGQTDASASTVVASFYLSSAVRGTTQTLTLQAKRDGGTTGCVIRADGGTNVVFTVIFVDEADTGA